MALADFSTDRQEPRTPSAFATGHIHAMRAAFLFHHRADRKGDTMTTAAIVAAWARVRRNWRAVAVMLTVAALANGLLCMMGRCGWGRSNDATANGAGDPSRVRAGVRVDARGGARGERGGVFGGAVGG